MTWKRSARTLTLYPKRLLNTADQAHDAKGLSALNDSPASSPTIHQSGAIRIVERLSRENNVTRVRPNLLALTWVKNSGGV
jgi:hypothetical protein